MIHRSSNCKAYTDTVAVLVNGTAATKTGGDKCKVSLPPTFSCQTEAFEAPDDVTERALRDEAMRTLKDRGCDVDGGITTVFETNLVGAQAMEYSAEKLKKLGLTSSCFREGNDPNHATHKATARCYPMREMTDADGNRVMNTNMQFLSNLATCDISDEAMPQLQEDLRKVAAHNAMENGFTVDRSEDLACYVSVLPVL